MLVMGRGRGATNGMLFGPRGVASGKLFSGAISGAVSESNCTGDTVWRRVHPPSPIQHPKLDPILWLGGSNEFTHMFTSTQMRHCSWH